MEEDKNTLQDKNTDKTLGKSSAIYLPWYLKILKSKFARRFARRTKRAIVYAMEGLGQEAYETKQMSHYFFRLLENKLQLEKRTIPPTPEEVKEAIEQLKDVARVSIFASISILPGGGFSLIGLELLARKFGIHGFTFVPSAFRNKKKTFLKPSALKEKTDFPITESNLEKNTNSDITE